MNSTILTILSLSISGSVLALLVLVLQPFMKNKVSKTFQYYIWLLVLLRLVLPLSFEGSVMNRILSQTDINQTPSAYHSGVPQTDNPTAAPQITTADMAPGNTGTPSPANASTNFSVWRFLVDNLIAIWLVGAALHLSWYIIVYLRFSRKIARTNVQPHPWDMRSFRKLCGDTKVELTCNPYIDTPMLIGILSPRVVIPQLAFVANGMESELQHIARHELTHYRRRDLLYKWFVVLVGSLHWFNPLMILVRREISRACELSCDEAVIRSLNAAQRQDYGETLLAIASNKRLPSSIVTTTMCEEKRKLKERLESIMTYKNKSVLMGAISLILALLLAGCSMALGAANITTGTSDNKPSPTPTTSDAPGASQTNTAGDPTGSALADLDSENSAQTHISSSKAMLEAYKAVMQNQADFNSTDNKKKLRLNDFLTNQELYGTKFEVTHFAVLDIDGDNGPDVVLELSVGNEPQFFEVLHYMDGQVYGYLADYRSLEALKVDGTFGFSSGAADSGWGKLVFEPDALKIATLAYSESKQGDTITIAYFINNQPASKEDFDAYADSQAVKSDVDWYEFTQENIGAKLV